MVVWGGNGSGGYRNTGGVYNPTTDSWTATATGGAPVARRGPMTAVWSGTEMLIWGGGDPMTNSGGRYDAHRLFVVSG